ncbi:NAD(P)-dependent alcohol dehydrogenase [Marininema halotolerans]|uniref:NADPH:quinone reductase n=1 Tax=Marininema halotolerans TaxID=1155944 RepID=A0A1I6U229_9BACL|nr:NAD(P)-dependent alcohol dehydrogenase [Marininema halotolerans]SFS95549.1 NADPH:quinone reductase [Marininema halotolerans]
MKAAFVDGNKQLVVGNKPKPKPKSHELLVKVQATSVNPSDWKMQKTFSKLGLSYRPGADFSGVVEEVGSKVTQFKKGDAVFSMKGPGGGTASEYLTVHEKRVVKKPDSVSFQQAAGVPTAGITAWHGLTTYGQLQPGQKVLIVGASGGMGTFAVQMAKALGAEVTGVCSTRNVDLVKELGADAVIDYTKGSVIDPALFGQFDLILDTVTTDGYKKYFPLLTKKGVYVTSVTTAHNFMGKIKGFFSFGGKRATVILVPSLGIKQLQEISQLMAQGKLQTHIGEVFTLDKIKEAFELSKTGRTRGKIVIQVSP